MGYRLYYAPKYEVEYAGGYFNWQTMEANQFLTELGVIADDDSSTVFEINKADFKTSTSVSRDNRNVTGNFGFPVTFNQMKTSLKYFH